MKNIAQKEERKQPKIKTEMNGKGLTVHAGLLPVLTFMRKLMFRERIREAVNKERGANAPVYEYFCYVTTEGISPIEAHRCYGERATCETWIEECKSQMNAGHIRTGEFLANAALFQCAVMAYNLLKWMALLAGGAIQRWEVKTMRLWLIRVAGKLITGSRQLTLKLPEKFLHQEEWRAWEGMTLSVEFG